MNWDALGALAELAGAAAVVITLAYLSVQIRQSAASSDREAANSDREAANEIARILGSNSEAARIYRAGSENRALLTPDEIIQFDSLCYLSLRGLHNTYMQSGAILFREAVYSFGRPGFRQYWDVHSGVFSEDFRREIARVLEQLDEPAAQQGAAADSA